MKTFTFDMVWQVSGKQTVQVPDEISTVEEAQAWVKNNWADIPIPTDGEYIPNSDEPDFESGNVELEE